MLRFWEGKQKKGSVVVIEDLFFFSWPEFFFCFLSFLFLFEVRRNWRVLWLGIKKKKKLIVFVLKRKIIAKFVLKKIEIILINWFSFGGKIHLKKRIALEKKNKKTIIFCFLVLFSVFRRFVFKTQKF